MVDELGLEQPAEAGGDRSAPFRLARRVLDEQNLAAAIAAGFVAALAGALAWGIAAYAAGASYSLFGIGVGVLVGWGVQVFGRGVDEVFGAVAVVFAVIACLAGNVAGVAIRAIARGTPASDILSSRGIGMIADTVGQSLGFMDVVGWIVSAFCAWWLAKRNLTKEEALAVYAYRVKGPG